MQIVSVNNLQKLDKKLGKAPARSHPNQLFLSTFLKTDVKAPSKYDYWKGKAKFTPYDLGNNEYGDCTIASQALLCQRMERIESKKTVIIPKDSIVKTYFNMTAFHYGGGDTGAFELDALNNWRDVNATFKDSAGRPYTIDAFVRINQANIEEVKQALFVAGAHGIKVCFSLPLAWSGLGPDDAWDLPEGQTMTGNWQPGSWGGHSMCAIAKYDENWLTLPSSWNQPDGKISWRAFAAYCDEAYICIDSIDAWRKKPAAKLIDLSAIRTKVNKVSRIKIA